MSPLLARLGIKHINYWVLDVEGAELEILEVCENAGLTQRERSTTCPRRARACC